MTQILSTTITGGNVAFSGMGDASQVINNVVKGDIESLKVALKELGVGSSDIEMGSKGIEEDGGELGSKVASCLVV